MMDGARARADGLRSAGATRAIRGRGVAGTEGKMGTRGAGGMPRAV